MKSSIDHLFPLKGYITQEIIDNSNVRDVYNCIGYNTLVQALGSENCEKYFSVMGWGNTSGSQRTKEDVSVLITTVEEVDMMDVTEPMEVTFILY